MPLDRSSFLFSVVLLAGLRLQTFLLPETAFAKKRNSEKASTQNPFVTASRSSGPSFAWEVGPFPLSCFQRSFRQPADPTAIAACMRRAMAMALRSSLFIATTTDPASLNIYNHLRGKFVWSEISSEACQHKILKTTQAACSEQGPLYMWLVNQPTIHMNHPNVKFLDDFASLQLEEPSPEIDEILFLSKHAAKSGTVSLTVHPVGIPWLDDASATGGIPGRCTPPSTHIAPLFRAVTAATKARGLDTAFQTSLEATHHGPYCEIPCCYVEIGSSASEWSNADAGDIWADCLGAHFQLPRAEDSLPPAVPEDLNTQLQAEQSIAIVLIGGGHYIPKMTDMLRLGSNIFVGHALATYTLEPHWPSADTTPTEDLPLRCKQIIEEAVQSTRIAFPSHQVVSMVDKRAFLERQRNWIGETLDALAVPWTFKTADIKTMAETAAKGGVVPPNKR